MTRSREEGRRSLHAAAAHFGSKFGIGQYPLGGGRQGVIIRGSSPEDSRILLDGFDIPQLYHFLNRSIVPTRAVAGLDYLPGGFDVRYGRASSCSTLNTSPARCDRSSMRLPTTDGPSRARSPRRPLLPPR